MFFLGGLELAFPFGFMGLIILGILALAAGRREPDATGGRAYAIYLCGVVFIAIFTLLFSALACISSITNLTFAAGEGSPDVCAVNPTLPECQFGEFDTSPEDNDRHISSAVLSGFIAIASALLLLFHVRRLRELVTGPPPASTEARRTFNVYCYAVCFVAVLVLLAAVVAAAFGLFRVITPDTTASFGGSSGERDAGFVQFITSIFVVAGSALIFVWHWRRVSPPGTTGGSEADARPTPPATQPQP